MARQYRVEWHISRQIKTPGFSMTFLENYKYTHVQRRRINPRFLAGFAPLQCPLSFCSMDTQIAKLFKTHPVLWRFLTRALPTFPRPMTPTRRSFRFWLEICRTWLEDFSANEKVHWPVLLHTPNRYSFCYPDIMICWLNCANLPTAVRTVNSMFRDGWLSLHRALL